MIIIFHGDLPIKNSIFSSWGKWTCNTGASIKELLSIVIDEYDILNLAMWSS